MLNSGAGKFERAADLVAKFYAHKLVQSHNEFTIKCTECDFKIDPRILLFGGEQAIIKALDSFGKCGAAKMQAVFELHRAAMNDLRWCHWCGFDNPPYSDPLTCCQCEMENVVYSSGAPSYPQSRKCKYCSRQEVDCMETCHHD